MKWIQCTTSSTISSLLWRLTNIFGSCANYLPDWKPLDKRQNLDRAATSASTFRKSSHTRRSATYNEKTGKIVFMTGGILQRINPILFGNSSTVQRSDKEGMSQSAEDWTKQQNHVVGRNRERHFHTACIRDHLYSKTIYICYICLYAYNNLHTDARITLFGVFRLV